MLAHDCFYINTFYITFLAQKLKTVLFIIILKPISSNDILKKSYFLYFVIKLNSDNGLVNTYFASIILLLVIIFFFFSYSEATIFIIASHFNVIKNYI